MITDDTAAIGELYDSFDAFLPIYFGFINPVIHQLDTGNGILNENQIKVLMAVWKTGGISQTDISKLLMIPKTSLTTIVRSLVELGLINRSGQDDDRRRYELSLTAAGRALLEKKRDSDTANFTSLFTGLTKEEASAVISGFRTLVHFFNRNGFSL